MKNFMGRGGCYKRLKIRFYKYVQEADLLNTVVCPSKGWINESSFVRYVQVPGK